jgi:hypothetical protein
MHFITERFHPFKEPFNSHYLKMPGQKVSKFELLFSTWAALRPCWRFFASFEKFQNGG